MSKARDLGASLLSQKQARDDKFSKKQRSYEKKLAWASLAVPAATKAFSTVLTDKANTWLSNEDVYQEKLDYQLARQNADAWMLVDKKIQESGGNAMDYYSNLNREDTRRRAYEALYAADKGAYVGTYGPTNAEVEKLLTEWATEQADDYNEAMTYIHKIGTPEEFTAMVDLNRKRARPTDPFDALFQKVGGWFKGVSQDERDQQAIDAIKNSRLGQDVDAFNLFMEEYNKTGNPRAAYNWASWASKITVDDPATPEDEAKTILYRQTGTDTKISSSGGVIYRYTAEEWTQLNNPTWKEPRNVVEEFMDLNLKGKSPATRAREAANKAFDDFNFIEVGFRQLETSAFSLFNNAVSMLGEDVSLANLRQHPRFVELLPEVSKIYAHIQSDPNNLRSDFKDQALRTQMDIVVNEYTQMATTLAELHKENDPIRYAEEIAAITKGMTDLLNAITKANQAMVHLGISHTVTEEQLNEMLGKP